MTTFDSVARVLDSTLAAPEVVSVPTARPRHGRQFQPKQELKLMPYIGELAGRFAKPGTKTILVKELAIPNGIVDAAGLIARPSVLRARLGAGVPPIRNEIDAAIVAQLSASKGMRESTLAARLGWHLDTIKRRLPTLIRSGAVWRRDTQSLQRCPALVPLGQTVAFEAKVRDWRRALAQGRTYGLFFDYSFAVLGAENSRWRDVRRQFQRARVGLAVSSRVQVRAPNRRLPRSRRLLASEYIIAGLMLEAQSPSP